ncbi:MAG: ATP-binding protein [Candidatus Acidiferrum sp.]
MNAKDLHQVISRGENAHVSFSTEAETESVAKIVCAFLNSQGGRLFLGVRKNQVPGVANVEVRASELDRELPSRISPKSVWTVEQVRYDNRDVLVIEVPEGKDKPYVFGGAIYLWRAKQAVPASRDEISELIETRAQASYRWERQPALGADRGDLDDELVLQTIARARDAQRWHGAQDDIDGFLDELGLIQDGNVTNACLLLYGKKPTRVLPQARVRVLVIPEGKIADRFRVDRMFEDCLLRLAKELPDALSVYVGGVESHFSKTTWERSDTPIYPMSALREGIMNALIHRDYASSASITIAIRSDSLKISNPGRLPRDLTLSDLKKDHPSLPRNPDIAHVCFLYGLIEKVGRGTQRILADCRNAHLRDPKWQTSGLETTLMFYSRVLSSSRSTEDLNPRQQQILKTVTERGRVTSSEIVKMVGPGVTDRTIRTDLQMLLDLGLVTRKGRGRATLYEAAGSAS